MVFEGKSMNKNPLKLYFHIFNWLAIYNIFNSLATVFRCLLPAIESSKRRIFLRKNNKTLIIACMQKFLTWIRSVNSSGFRFRFSLCSVYFSRLHNYFIHSSDLRPEKGPRSTYVRKCNFFNVVKSAECGEQENYLGTMEWLFSRFRRLFFEDLDSNQRQTSIWSCSTLAACVALIWLWLLDFSWLRSRDTGNLWWFSANLCHRNFILALLICFLDTFENSCGISGVYFILLSSVGFFMQSHRWHPF